MPPLTKHGAFRYMPALDGLRAIAIALVVATHVGLPKVGGYHGVTVFFVVSGYLITSLLMKEHSETGEIRFLRFYQRRFARLAPAMMMVIAVTTVWMLAARQPVSTFWAGLVGSITYTTNIFETTAAAEFINRAYEWSWSLSVEEQFYFVWPVLLLLVLKTRRFKLVVAVLLAIVPVEWVIRALLARTDQYRSLYYGPFSHLDALALGVIIAIVLALGKGERWVVLAGRIAGPVGLIGLVVLFLKPQGLPALLPVDPGGFGQAAICSAFLVLWVVVTPQGPFSRVLSIRPLVFLGKLSYGLYLWNMLLVIIFQAVTGMRPAESWLLIPWLAVLVAIAYASWRFVETPLRVRWSPRHSAPTSLPSGRDSSDQAVDMGSPR